MSNVHQLPIPATTEEVTDAIKELVENGIKATELVAQLASQFKTRLPPSTDVLGLLDKMVHDGEIVEVEYILPHLDFRIKSMYFPAGTSVSITK